MGYRLSKIYTKTGDKGDTGLAGGQRVRKNSIRIEAYGCVDELNSVLGLIRAYTLKEKMSAPARKEMNDFLKKVQNTLFHLGGDLATLAKDRHPKMHVITEADVQELEGSIDRWQKDLKPLKEFILPGGGVISAWLHLARTVSRRAERAVVALQDKEEVNPQAVPYLNRLSDAFFVLARWICKQQGEEEILWEHK